MSDRELVEEERVALEVIDVLGGKASFVTIKTMVRAQFRRELRATLLELVNSGLVLRFSLGQYALTKQGREALKEPYALREESSQTFQLGRVAVPFLSGQRPW